MKLYRNNKTRLSRVLITGVAVGATLFGASALKAQNSTTPPDSTQASAKISHRAKEFLKEAGQANQTELAAANVALSKSQNAQVKDLANMMLTDHQKNFAQVQSLAQTYGVTLETGLDMMNQHEVNRLQKANDANFDKDYTKMMLKDHVKVIKRFKKAALEIEEPNIKQYAQETLPALRHHLQKSEEAARSVGVDDATISSYLKDLPSEDRPVAAQ
jgi:putative membrane protein